MRNPTICFAVLNYNGQGHLRELLPTLLEAVRHYPHDCPIVILDNQSTEGDVTWLTRNYPSVDVVVAPSDDYLFSYNWLLPQRKEDIVILLNNDVRVSPNLIGILARHFNEPTTFAVSCKAFTWDGLHVNSGPCTFDARRGWLKAEYAFSRQRTSYTLFPGGACIAVDRLKFLALGGFDRLFYPAYGEDKDLGFRAWCKGWKCIYEPNCHIFHREGGTWDVNEGTAEGGGSRPAALIERTNYFFMWRNLRHSTFRLNHAVYLSWLICRKTAERDVRWLNAFREARQLWKQRRGNALRNSPERISLSALRQICGSPVVEPRFSEEPSITSEESLKK